MNHAILIIAHNNPQLLKAIVSKLQDTNHYFFIHIDLKADLSVFKNMLKDDCNKNVFFLENRINVNWGVFTDSM